VGVASRGFKKLIRSRTDIAKIVVSNCDNLGKKYFPELMEDDGLSYPVVTNRKFSERMDGIYLLGEQIGIIPYFREKEKSTSIGFTGTVYVAVNSLLSIFDFHNREEYCNSDSSVRNIDNHFTPIVKLLKSARGDRVTLHFESVLSDISNFVKLSPIFIDRDLCFFPFKTIEDVNEDYLSKWRDSVNKNKYIIYK